MTTGPDIFQLNHLFELMMALINMALKIVMYLLKNNTAKLFFKSVISLSI